MEEQQQRQKLSRDKEMMKRRSLDTFQKDIQLRQREFEQKVGMPFTNDKNASIHLEKAIFEFSM